MTFKLGKSYYTIVKHEPSTTFMQTLINIINVCGLWHGVNIVLIVSGTIEVIIKTPFVNNISKTCTSSKINLKKHLKLLFLFLVSIFLLRQLYKSSLEYFESKTILRMNIKNIYDEIEQGSIKITFIFQANQNNVDRLFFKVINSSSLCSNINSHIDEGDSFGKFWVHCG